MTGFEVQLMNHVPEKCSRTRVDLSAMNIGGGVALGQSESDFKAHLPVHFIQRGRYLVYEVEYQRRMTDEELVSMRRQWPDMPSPSFFDVVEFVRAKFRAGALELYEARRTESY